MCSQQQQPLDACLTVESSSLSPSEERRRTGQYIVVGVIIVASLIGLYHACMQQNAMLAGFIAPSIIMLLYLLWVLHTARRSKDKQVHQQRPQRQPLDIPEVVVKKSTAASQDST